MPEHHINSVRVRDAFSRAVDSYDEHAVLQREIADRLVNHLEFAKIKPGRILDIGCGTGYCTRLLRERFKRAHVHGLDVSAAMLVKANETTPRGMPWHGRCRFQQAEAMYLPYRDGAFDLVCSNLTMQWVADPEKMLAEMRRVLAPGGLLIFSTFGRRTLSELRQSLAEISHENAGLVLPFPDVMTLGDALMKLSVELPVTDSDIFTLTYPDTMALVRELKHLGASSSAIANRPGGLYGRGLLKKLDQTYGESHRMEDGRIRATFEALYAQAWYAEEPFKPGGEIIPIEPESYV